MSRHTLSALGLGLMLITALGFQGCAASPTASDVSNTAGALGAQPTAGEAGESDALNAAAGSAQGGGSGGLVAVGEGGMPDIGEECAADVTTAVVRPLDIYIMLDTSLSMAGNVSGSSTKWSQVRSALRGFLRAKSSQGLGVGLQYFPQPNPEVPAACFNNAECGAGAPCASGICYDILDIFGELYPCELDKDCQGFGKCVPRATCENDKTYFCKLPTACGKAGTVDLGACLPEAGFCTETSLCTADAYAKPDQEIANLPGAATSLIASLDAQTPAGNTPTGPALRGALEQATDWATAHPEHRVVAVLATDGAPSNCSPLNIDEIGDIAADAVAAETSIKTVVIGVLSPDDVLDGLGTNLNTVARAGGTKKAIIVDTTMDVAAQFTSALDSIRTDLLTCEFVIPEPKEGKDFDFSHVNVSFTQGKKVTELFYVASIDDCDPDTGGWYYDSDPRSADPKTILVCPTNCAKFQATTNASVEIALGCATIVK